MSEKPPTRELLAEFDALHIEKLGTCAVIYSGKDAALLSAVWRVHGTEATIDAMRRFFASPDPWLRSTSYSVGVFCSQVGRFVRATPAARPDWRAECADRHGSRCESATFHAAMVEDGR